MNTFKKFLNEAPVITEAKDLFPEVDIIKIDPDRADVYDIVSHLMPTLARVAYTHLVQDRDKYSRGKDEEDPKFEFTEDALDDALGELIKTLVNRFEDQNSHDRKSYIDKVKSEFKDKLEK